MKNNYLVFDNIVELNKDEDLKPNSFELSIYLLTALKNPGIIIGNSIIKEEDLENRSKKYNITKLGFFISQ